MELVRLIAHVKIKVSLRPLCLSFLSIRSKLFVFRPFNILTLKQNITATHFQPYYETHVLFNKENVPRDITGVTDN